MRNVMIHTSNEEIAVTWSALAITTETEHMHTCIHTYMHVNTYIGNTYIHPQILKNLNKNKNKNKESS